MPNIKIALSHLESPMQIPPGVMFKAIGCEMPPLVFFPKKKVEKIMEKTRPPKQHDLATQIFWSEFRCVFTQPQITLELSPTPARNAAMSSGHARQQRIHPKQHVRHLKHRK